MSEIQKFVVKDNGEEYEFYIEPGALAAVETDEEGDYRDISLPTIDMKKVHQTIRGYARYAVGAFINFGLAEIEEMNLEFNLKISGKAGMPILAEGSAKGSFKVQVKCKFPDNAAKG
ncbi:MAG: CU044_2847 family protein [Cyanobacteria bacterium P01_A01_bin.123]